MISSSSLKCSYSFSDWIYFYNSALISTFLPDENCSISTSINEPISESVFSITFPFFSSLMNSKENSFPFFPLSSSSELLLNCFSICFWLYISLSEISIFRPVELQKSARLWNELKIMPACMISLNYHLFFRFLGFLSFLSTLDFNNILGLRAINLLSS